VSWPANLPAVESTHLLWTLDDQFVLSACHEKKERDRADGKLNKLINKQNKIRINNPQRKIVKKNEKTL
jgi:hypothetical protein